MVPDDGQEDIAGHVGCGDRRQTNFRRWRMVHAGGCIGVLFSTGAVCLAEAGEMTLGFLELCLIWAFCGGVTGSTNLSFLKLNRKKRTFPVERLIVKNWEHYYSWKITRTLILLLLSNIGYCSPYSVSYNFFVCL
jgi:hypothetical protein